MADKLGNSPEALEEKILSLRSEVEQLRGQIRVLEDLYEKKAGRVLPGSVRPGKRLSDYVVEVVQQKGRMTVRRLTDWLQHYFIDYDTANLKRSLNLAANGPKIFRIKGDEKTDWMTWEFDVQPRRP